MSHKRRVIFVVTALQILLATVSFEETQACDLISNRTCDAVTSDLVQKCIRENPQIDDVKVPYFGVEDIKKEIHDGPSLEILRKLETQTAEQGLAHHSEDLQDSAVCTWEYRNLSDSQRIPSNISYAYCNDEDTTYTDSFNTEFQCRQMWYPMNVLKWSCSRKNNVTELKWKFTHELVSFGCSLKKIRS